MPQSQVARPHDEPSVPDMPGIKAEGELARSLRHEVADLLGRSQLGFPGAQPVSFNRSHLEVLRQEDYYLCEKSDGIRCLMYFTRDGDKEIHYLIDRKNEYYYVPGLHFPLPDDPQFRSFHTETIIDGELVLDREPGRPARVLKYLVFDCLMIDNKTVMERTLDKRLAYFREYVYNPYRHLCKTYPQEVEYFPFQLEFKHMEFSYAIEKVFRDVLPNLKHGNDGLIFTCRTSPYQFGTDPHILKWKPAEENSVDFRMHLEWQMITDSPSPPSSPMSGSSSPDRSESSDEPYPDYDAIPKFHLYVYAPLDRPGAVPDPNQDGDYIWWGDMYVTDEEWENLKALNEPLDETIVECHMETIDGRPLEGAPDELRRWRFMRFRYDKSEANHVSTVKSVMRSIEDGVHKEELMGAWKGVREAWKIRNPSRQ